MKTTRLWDKIWERHPDANTSLFPLTETIWRHTTYDCTSVLGARHDRQGEEELVALLGVSWCLSVLCRSNRGA